MWRIVYNICSSSLFFIVPVKVGEQKKLYQETIARLWNLWNKEYFKRDTSKYDVIFNGKYIRQIWGKVNGCSNCFLYPSNHYTSIVDNASSIIQTTNTKNLNNIYNANLFPVCPCLFVNFTTDKSLFLGNNVSILRFIPHQSILLTSMSFYFLTS